MKSNQTISGLKKKTRKLLRNSKDYPKKDNQSIINKVAKENLNFINSYSISKCFRKSRCQIIKFMLHAIEPFNFFPQTVFIAVGIMDSYLKIRNEESMILVLTTSLFIASKIEHGIKYKIKYFIKYLLNDLYSIDDIISQEVMILKSINWNILFITVYDIIKSKLDTLIKKHIIMIDKLNLINFFKDVEKCAISLAKISLHLECFSNYENSKLAISFIIIAIYIKKQRNDQELLKNQKLFICSIINYSLENYINEIFALFNQNYKIYKNCISYLK